MTHEFDGKKYEKASAHQKEWGAKLISELRFTGNERVLDLGCGDGAITLMMADLLPDGEVIGIDASKGMIDAARPKEKNNLRFLLIDIDEMAFSDEFDIIFSNAALHWVKDHSRLLKNSYKALRTGGLLRFNFAAAGNCSHFFKVILKAMVRNEFKRYFDAFVWPWYMPSVEEYTRLLNNSELKEFKVWGENADRFFPDTQTLINWIDQPSLVPFWPYIPEKDRNVFRDYVTREMIKETKQEDGRCFETFRRINLLVRR